MLLLLLLLVFLLLRFLFLHLLILLLVLLVLLVLLLLLLQKFRTQKSVSLSLWTFLSGHGFTPRDSFPNAFGLACFRHSFRVDALMRFVTGSFANILIVAPTLVAWPGKVIKCKSVQRTTRTFEHVRMTVRARKGYLRSSTPKTANIVCLSSRL